MRSTILFAAILAVSLTTAVPLRPAYLYTMDEDLEGSEDPVNDRIKAEQAEQRVAAAAEIINNDYIPKMEHMLNDPTKEEHAKYLKAAFGPQYNLNQVKKNVAALKGDDAEVIMHSRFPMHGSIARTIPQTDDDGKLVMDEDTGHPSMLTVQLGNGFFKEGRTANDDADTILHESIHYVAGSGSDHIIKANKIGNKRPVVYQPHLHGDSGIGNPSRPDDTAHKNILVAGGYMFKEREDEPGAFRKVPHSELVEHGPAALDGTMFQKVTKHTEDMDLVPDAYVAFAGYAGHHDEHDMCTRSLYKRALEQDDPVGYYLAKRGGCMARINKAMNTEGHTKADKRLANKNKVGSWLAAQGTANNAAQRNIPKAIQGSKAKKESKVGNARKSPTARRKALANAGNAAKKAQIRKAANRRKSNRIAKSPQAPKGPSAGKRGKATNLANNTRGRGRKTARIPKVTRGRQARPNVRGVNARKSRKGRNAAKSRNGPNRKVAKTRGARGTQGGKKGHNTNARVKYPKATGKGVKRPNAKGANRRKPHTVGKARKPARTRSGRAERARARKQNARKAIKNKQPSRSSSRGGNRAANRQAAKNRQPSRSSSRPGSRAANRQATKNNQPSRALNRGGNQGASAQASKGTVIPNVQKKVANVTPAAKFAIPQKGKRN